jgi:hypothetical protein
MAASTAARRMMDRHGGGNPIHCSRNSSSWIRIHMPSGTSRNTVSKRRSISSNPLRLPPEEHVMAPHQGHQIGASSPVSRALLVAPQPHPVRLSPRGGLPSRCTGGLYNSTSRPRGAKSAHAPNKQQQMVSVSIHQTYALVYQNHNINQNI